MGAIILAGGKGIRLAPLSEVIPKPLIPKGGRPILEIVNHQLKHQGCRHITLAVGYMSDLIQAYFQEGSRWGVSIDYSVESEPLGTAAPPRQISGLDRTYLVMNADVLTNINYAKLLRYHKKHQGSATIGAYERQVTIDHGVIIRNGRRHISMGVYVFEPEVLDYIGNKAYLDFPDLVKLLLGAGKMVNYYPFSGYWLDVGRHEDYAKAAEEFEARKGEFSL